MKKKTLFFGLTLLMGLILGLALAVKFNLFSVAQSKDTNIASVQDTVSLNIPSLEGLRMEDAVINVADTTGKAVVSISTEHTTKLRGAQKRFYFRSPFGPSPFGEDEFFDRFFDEFFGAIPDREFKQIGLGSGVIIDPQGYILTNEHVIEGADKITVTLSDGRKFKGEIKGQDARSDLAIIKIEEKNLPVAILGDSGQLKIGQWVVAVGNPFAFAMENPEPTVTVGVISALHRSLGRALAQDRDYNDLIQTDAAINPGNSGGPLVNLKGEVVGINVAIFSTSGGYQGIGFAIPINNAKRIISQLIAGKKIVYGWLGVTVQNLNEELVKYFNLPDKNGALVANVLKDSPAEKAGIKASDVIKKIDNQPINSVKELLSIVGKAQIGSRIKVTVLREKKELNLEVTVGERPENLEKEEEIISSEIPGSRWRGLTVDELNQENLQHFRIEEREGVVVTDIEPGSPADESGIMPGDVIKEINGKKVSNLSNYQRIIQDVKGDCLLVTSRGYFIIKEIEK
jgi:serine protease Do